MSESAQINLIGRISHFFAVNRSLSILFLVAVLSFGLLAFFLTPKQYNPEIVRPAFAITLHYDGATVVGATDRLVYELVEKVRSVPGVDDIYTNVHDGATVETTVIFEVGYDATKAKLDLLSQIDQHQYVRTGLISEPLVREINPETIPVLHVVFGAEALAITDVRERVIDLSRRLGDVESVSEVSVHGGYTPAVVVELDPARLATTGLTVEAVRATLADSQVRRVYDGPTSGAYQIPLLFEGVVGSPAAIGALVVREGVRIRDVAMVYSGHAGDRSYVLHQGREVGGEAVVLAVSKVEGKSAPVVTQAVLERIAELVHEREEFQGLQYTVVSDDGATATAEVNGLTRNLLTSIAIVALVLMLFLSVRAATVVLVAIPVTLLIVFGLGWLFGETINRITLFALILSLGLLVDSAIVVVENIYSHLREWRMSPSAASRERVIAGAVHEIGVGLLLSTVTSVIVFLPMAYITGMMGPYMGPIAFFVPAALIVSLFVAVVVTPFVALQLLDGEERPNRVNAFFAGLMTAITHRYVDFLTRVLAHRSLQRWVLRGALGLFLVALIWPLTGLVHFQMLPKADRDQFYVYLDLPIDIGVEATRSAALRLVDVLMSDTAVVDAQVFVAEPPVLDFNGMFKGAQNRTGSHQATIRVNVEPAADRARSSTEVVNDLRATLAAQDAALSLDTRFMEEPPGPPVRATFEAKVSARDGGVQAGVAERLETALATVNGVVDMHRSSDESVGRVVYRLDREAAAAQGVSATAVADAVQLLDGSVVVNEFLATDQGEFASLTLTLPAEQRSSPVAITGLFVSNDAGQPVSLTELVTMESMVRPSVSALEGTTPVTYLTSEVEGRSIIYVMIEVISRLVRGEVEGLQVEEWGLFGMQLIDIESGAVVQIAWGGEWEMTLENFRDLGIAMGVALLLVYVVLVAQYNRFSTPAYILVTVPLGLIGILFGFLFLDQGFGIYLTATALIGFIALIGIVVNNAIIYLEYVEQAVAAGRSFQNALVEAGAARLRPIVLTSLTTVLGSLTIASDPVWSGLAWAIVFGLSLSTILTLIVYPVLLMYYTGHTRN